MASLGGGIGCHPFTALVRRAIVAAPFVTAGEAAQIGARNNFAELLIKGTQRTEFRRECWKKLG